MGKIGLQLYSIKEAAEKDLLRTLEKVAEMGYSGAQFAGFFDHSAEEVKAKLDEVGLVPAGAHVSIEQLQNDFEATLTYHKTIGNDVLIVPGLPESMRTTAADYKRTAGLLNEIGKNAHVAGFSIGYHNHDFEFDTFDGKTGFDSLFENSEPNYLKIELDCFWAAYTDNDPLKVIEKYRDRIVSLHIKDLKLEGDQPVSTEIGTGNLDLAAYMKAGKKYGVTWFNVEQEEFTKDPLESASENAIAIKKLLDTLS